jgi:enamine deaminase RidA (YjgF/YER057c/UK114 family)
MRALQPPGWERPKGYSNGIEAEGRLVFVAGQVGWDNGVWKAHDFAGQFRQVLVNTLAVLKEAGAGPEHIARMTWFITSREEYENAMAEVGAAWRELMGRVFPTMAVIIVAGLVDRAAKIEIETTAVVPR